MFATLLSDPLDIASGPAAGRSGSAGAVCKSLPFPMSAIPCWPFKKMLFERIESPVPDWTQNTGLHVVGDRIPLAAARAADRVIRRVIAEDDSVDLVPQRCQCR